MTGIPFILSYWTVGWNVDLFPGGWELCRVCSFYVGLSGWSDRRRLGCLPVSPFIVGEQRKTRTCFHQPPRILPKPLWRNLFLLISATGEMSKMCVDPIFSCGTNLCCSSTFVSLQFWFFFVFVSLTAELYDDTAWQQQAFLCTMQIS